MTDTPDSGPTIAVDEPKARRQSFARRHWLGLLLTLLVFVPIAAVAAWATASLAYPYSSGTRSGYNQKLSRKGWICKTWEGELATSAVPGVSPTIFHYSVRSDSVAHAIEKLGGQLVMIHYEEHRGVPTSCFGETDYFATGVEKVGG